jgi:hypothetical protein
MPALEVPPLRDPASFRSKKTTSATKHTAAASVVIKDESY